MLLTSRSRNILRKYSHFPGGFPERQSANRPYNGLRNGGRNLSDTFGTRFEDGIGICAQREIGKSADFFPRPDALRYNNSISSGLNAGLKRRHREQKTMDRPYYILLADNHAGFRREVRKILEEIPGVKVTGEAGNRGELFELLRQSPPKLVILDISLPDLRAREGTQFIKLHYPETKVLIMVMDQEQRIPALTDWRPVRPGSCRNSMWRDKSLGPLPPCARVKSMCRPRLREKILPEWRRRRPRGLAGAGGNNC